MVQFATVSLKTLQEQSRFDAEFHVIWQRLTVRVDALKAVISIEEAQQRLAALPLRYKACLMHLSRGDKTKLSATAVAKVVTEYPHLSLALLEESRHEVAAAERRELAAGQEALERLEALTDPGSDDPAVQP